MSKKVNVGDVAKTALKVGSLPVKTLGKTILSWAILLAVGIVIIVGVCQFGIPAFGSLFQSFSPWSQQRQEIANKNNVRDAYSAIVGSDVGMISQNGIVKWFSSREAKEIDISIPKLINYSPLFDDESNRNGLKDAFENSLNADIMNQSTKYYQIFYDGSTLGKWKNGEKVSSYKDLKSADKKNITNDLKLQLLNLKKLKFKDWQKYQKLPNVVFDFVNETNTVKITGVFETDGALWFTSEYKISVKYKLTNDKWKMVDGSLKVEKNK